MWHCRRVPSKAYLEFGNLNKSACTSAWERQRLNTVMKALGLLEKRTKERRLSFFSAKDRCGKPSITCKNKSLQHSLPGSLEYG